jgi:hypothetical protein
MACRKVITARQMRAAQMLLEGKSAYSALTKAGYSHWTARSFGKLLRGSWGLREAIRLSLEEAGRYLVTRPVRKRQYDRRSLARNVLQYVGEDIQRAPTNSPIHKLYKNGKSAQEIAKNKSPVPLRCSLCSGLLEGNDHWCPYCQRVES